MAAALAIGAPALVLLQTILGATYRHKHRLDTAPGRRNAGFSRDAGRCHPDLRQYPEHRTLRSAAIWSIAVVVAQVLLGVTALTMQLLDLRRSMALVISTASHVVVGSLTLAASLVLAMQVQRHVRRRAASALGPSFDVQPAFAVPSDGDQRGHACDDQRVDARIPMRALIREHLPTEVDAGVKKRYAEYTLAGVVEQPRHQDARGDAAQRPPTHPVERSVHFDQRNRVPTAQTIPSRTPDASALQRACNASMAYPDQPSSSASAATNNTAKSTGAVSSANRGAAGSGRPVERISRSRRQSRTASRKGSVDTISV